LYPQGAPEEGSPAANEVETLDAALAGEWSGAPATLTFGAAQLHIRNAQDHLFGLGLLLASNAEDSVMTVARGATEAAARAAWLLDGAIEGRRRIARTMTERLAGLAQEADLNARIGRVLDTADQVSRIERSAVAAGFAVRRGRRGRLYVGEEEYPGSTQAIQLLFGDLGENFGVRAYADLSAVAHSTLAAFATPPRLDVLSERCGPPSGPDAELPIERGVVIALAAFERAVRVFFTVYGWNVVHWNDFLRQAHHRMRELIGVPSGLIDLIRVRRQDQSPEET